MALSFILFVVSDSMKELWNGVNKYFSDNTENMSAENGMHSFIYQT